MTKFKVGDIVIKKPEYVYFNTFYSTYGVDATKPFKIVKIDSHCGLVNIFLSIHGETSWTSWNSKYFTKVNTRRIIL